MMSGRTTAADLALVNFIVADHLNAETGVHRSSTLYFVAKQLNNTLREKPAAYRGAFVAYWIYKRKPFSKVNLATATALGLSIAKVNQSERVLADFAEAIRSGAKIDTLCAIIE